MSISAIIITKNAEHFIKRCLDSIKWMDEIIVLDSGSTDNTVSICETYADKVYQTDWPGFGKQKNRALEKASSDWIFSIDADEWISPELKEEIQTVLRDPKAFIFSIPRRTQYFGEWIYHGDVGKDKVIRLFKKGCTQFSDDVVHESLMTAGQTIGELKQVLFHDSYQSVEQLLDRMNRYTTLSATMRHEKGKKSSLRKAIIHGLWAFLKSYFFRAGFLDGRIGFIVAVSSAESSYYRYLKLFYQNKGIC